MSRNEALGPGAGAGACMWREIMSKKLSQTCLALLALSFIFSKGHSLPGSSPIFLYRSASLCVLDVLEYWCLESIPGWRRQSQSTPALP